MKGFLSLIILTTLVLPHADGQTATKQFVFAHPDQTPSRNENPCASQAFVQPPAKYATAVTNARRAICEQLIPEVGGVQIAVAVDGRLVWSEGFGYADIERHLPVTATTMFRIGSVSKPLTADAVALLVKKGKFDLDAPIQRYVPTFPLKQWPITPRGLGGHIAGIRGYIKDYEENHSNKHYPTVTSGLAIFANDSLLFEPATQFSYSTYGYSLLSAAVEGASGEDFPSFMAANVLRPTGMSNTVVELVGSPIAERAETYEPDSKSGRLELTPPIDNSYKWAGGGYLSTAEDLVRFGSAHLNTERLGSAALNLLFTSMRTRDGSETGYGLGWYTNRDERGHRVVSHTGSAVGGSAILVVDRDSKVVFAMCLNVSGTPQVGAMLSPVWSEIPKLFDEAIKPTHLSKVQRQILELEEQRRQALLRSDADALNLLMADDYSEIAGNGEVRTKTQNLADIKLANTKFDFLDFDDLKVRNYGGTAVVTGLIVRKGVSRGQRFRGQFRYTRVYARKDGRWQAVAQETTHVD
jgi:serine beta-lactamase-like protein LACTB